MGRRKATYVLPRLNDGGGDMKRSWYVEYSYRNSTTDKLERFRIYEGFKSLDTEKQRRKHAESIIKKFTDKILSGWTPFDADRIVITDHLIYHNEARYYGNSKETSKNLSYYINLFLDIKLPHISHKSGLDYKSKFRLFENWLKSKGYQEIFAPEVTNELLADYINTLIFQGLQRRTIAKTKQHLRQLFDYLVHEKVVLLNPVCNLPDGKQSIDASAQAMTEYEASKLLNHIKKNDRQLYLFCAMIFYCAIRPGKELRLLKVKDINLINQTIIIRAENAKTSAGVINIPPHLVEILQEEEINLANREYYVFGKLDNKPGLTHWGKNHFRLAFNKYRDELNYPEEYKLYSWKCTGAILFVQSGAPLTAVRDHLRHKSTAYTDYYVNKRLGKQNDYVKHKFPKL